MSLQQLTVDLSVANLLCQAKGPTEIRDPGGRLIGVYEPVTSATELLDFARANFDLERARRIVREQSGKGITTPELLKKLSALEPTP